jgi:hypothetical protein
MWKAMVRAVRFGPISTAAARVPAGEWFENAPSIELGYGRKDERGSRRSWSAMDYIYLDFLASFASRIWAIDVHVTSDSGDIDLYSMWWSEVLEDTMSLVTCRVMKHVKGFRTYVDKATLHNPNFVSNFATEM